MIRRRLWNTVIWTAIILGAVLVIAADFEWSVGLLVLALVVGVCAAAFVFWSMARTHSRMLANAIEVDDDGLRVVGRQGEQYVSWSDVRAAYVYLDAGGDRWVVGGGSAPTVTFNLKGLSLQESRSLDRAVRRRLPDGVSMETIGPPS